MEYIEKITRKIEIDECSCCDIYIRETTHLVDKESGEIVHRAVKHHRKVVECGNDDAANNEGLGEIAKLVWTPEMRATKNMQRKMSRKRQVTDNKKKVVKKIIKKGGGK